MTFFHVRLSQRGQPHDEVKLDLDEESLDSQFVTPYRMGDSITVNGRTIPVDEIERIKISASADASSDIIATLQKKDRNSPVVRLGGPGYKYRAAANAEDVTDNYITGPPGSARRDLSIGTIPSTLDKAEASADNKSVFLVSGRDTGAATAIKIFLRSLSVQVIEWEDAVFRVGTPNPYVGDVVMAGMRLARAVLVLFTPDDIVSLRPDLIGDEDGADERELRGQARPNVLYEAGIADTLGRERTILVEVGPVKPFSDLSGRLILRYDGSAITRKSLIDRLKSTGLEVDANGSDWLTDGDAASAIDAARTALRQTDPALQTRGADGAAQFGTSESFGDAGERITAVEGNVRAELEGLRAGSRPPVAHGRVYNNESYKVELVTVTITYYDHNNATIGSAWGSVSNIAPGQTKAIECTASESSVTSYARHFVQINDVL